MSPLSRRDLCQQLPLLALLPAFAAAESPMQSQNTAPATAGGARPCSEPVLTACEAFPFEGLPVRYSGTGAPTRQILEGRIPAGEIIELHETTLAPGQMPHPAHQHPHAELLLVRFGTLEFQSDAPAIRITAGGAAYCAPNRQHGFRNVGEGDATYFILKIGAQPVCQK